MLRGLHACGCSLLQDTSLQWRRGDVTLNQVVSEGKWLSMPSPEIKVQPGTTPQHSSCRLRSEGESLQNRFCGATAADLRQPT